MKNVERTLQVLIQRSFDGDRTAYQQFLKELRQLLRAYIRRQLYRFARTDCDAEDIVQETLLAIHSRWHTYDRSMPVTAWAHAIARYKLVDFLRNSARRSRDLSFDDIEQATTEGYATEISMTLSALIAALPSNLRRPVELVRLQGFSVREAAAATGLSEASVKVNIHRAVKAIARGFGK